MLYFCSSLLLYRNIWFVLTYKLAKLTYYLWGRVSVYMSACVCMDLLDVWHTQPCRLWIETIIPPFPNCITSFTSSCNSWTFSKMMLSRNDGIRHSGLLSDLRGKKFNLSPLSMTLAQVFWGPDKFKLCRWWSFILFLVCWVFIIPNLFFYYDELHWFSNVEPGLHSLDKTHLGMIYYPFSILLDLICKHLVDNFCNSIHEI